ncbi:MAG: hypothetical protein ACRBB0_26460 [Pelagimonas sp.]|uniref:hypothetical protein n=1 Tax=Pelagimonas sp. TaxID=2073170 RepID=UPI003D6BD5D6
MSLTKTADLMALFDVLFEASRETTSTLTPTCASTLSPPSAELSAPLVPLKEMMDADGSVITKSLGAYAERHAPHLADEFANLALVITDGQDDFQPAGAQAKRMLDFVYPVV